MCNLNFSNSDIYITDMNFEDLENLKDDLFTSFDDFWNYDILKSELLSDSSKYIIAKLNDNVEFLDNLIIFTREIATTLQDYATAMESNASK